jgi:hypothetical protein
MQCISPKIKGQVPLLITKYPKGQVLHANVTSLIESPVIDIKSLHVWPLLRNFRLPRAKGPLERPGGPLVCAALLAGSAGDRTERWAERAEIHALGPGALMGLAQVLP